MLIKLNTENKKKEYVNKTEYFFKSRNVSVFKNENKSSPNISSETRSRHMYGIVSLPVMDHARSL